MLTVLEFKKKYPRQYKKLIEYYGGYPRVFDRMAAISMYLRGAAPPSCTVCGALVTIKAKFRDEGPIKVRCKQHANTDI